MKLANRLLNFLPLLLLVSMAVVPAAAVETASIEDGYEPVWSGELNLTVYLPETTLHTMSEKDMSAQLSSVAERPVTVWHDSAHPGLRAVTLTLTFSTARDAVSWEEYKSGSIELAATSNSSDSVYDMVPDERAVEQAERNTWDLVGTKTTQYSNATDIDTSVAYEVDFTNFNYSDGRWWLYVEEFKGNSGANATVNIEYVNSTGLAGVNQSVVNTDYYITAEDTYFSIPAPTTTGSTYLSKLYFDDVALTKFAIMRFSGDFEELPTLTFGETASSIAPLAVFTGFGSSTISKISSTPVSSRTGNTAQVGVGFQDMRESALSSAAGVLGITRSSIVDHKLNSGKEQVTFPSKLTSTVYQGMRDRWDAGEKSAQSLNRAARDTLKAVTVTAGVKATSFAGRTIDYAKEMGSKTVGAIADSQGKSVTASSASGSSIFDKVKDAAGRLPTKAASMFAKLNPDLFQGLKSNLKWIIIAIVAGVAALVLVRSMQQ